MFSNAFPDPNEEFEFQSVEGNVVRGLNRTTGTHGGDFDLSAVGLGVISATGK
jgi:hypothetical protein